MHRYLIRCYLICNFTFTLKIMTADDCNSCVCVCVFQLCDSQTVVILDLAPKPQTVEFVNLQPFDDDESREQDLTSSATNTTDNRCVCVCVSVKQRQEMQPQHAVPLPPPGSFQTPEAETLSPELREEDADGTFRDESPEQRLSAPSHRGDDKKHNNNNLLTCKR